MQQRLLLLQIQFDSERKDAELVRLREEKECLVQQKQNSSTLYHLTPRELAILKLLTDGLSYKQTAAHLGIAYETAKEHVGNLYKKLGVKTNTEAVAKAMKEGLV
jgi:DNA-binding NarL/FixJ family response regulator